MPHKLIITVVRFRQDGWPLPRFRHATERRFTGVLMIREEVIDGRHVQVARLIDAATGAEVKALPQLLSVQQVSQTAEEMLQAGLERTEDLGRVIDPAQEWRVALGPTEEVL